MPWLIVDSRLLFTEQTFTTLDEALVYIIYQRLSPVAHAILRESPSYFRNGNPVSTRVLADLLGYNDKKPILRGLHELISYGFVTTVPYGQRGRRRYIGVPPLMWSPPVKSLISREELRAA